MRILILLGALGVGCKAPPTPVDPGTCAESEDPVVELSQGDAWVIEDGTPVQFGIPPQGGAPYAPFEIRLRGMPFADDYAVVLEATRVSDQLLIGTGDYVQRFVCANVGENQGTRYTPELHMRFFTFEPPDLEGDTVDVEITVTPADGGEAASARFRGELDWVLGPLPE